MKPTKRDSPTLAGYFAMAPTPQSFLRLFAGQERAILDMRATGMADRKNGEYLPPDGEMKIAYDVGWRCGC